MIRDEFDDVLDGIVYGAALGAGFGAAETFLYAAGGTAALSGGTVVALLIAGLNHAFYTAVFGGILGYARNIPERGSRFAIITLGFATACCSMRCMTHCRRSLAVARPAGRGDRCADEDRGGPHQRDGAAHAGRRDLVGAAARGADLRHHLKPEVESGVISQVDYDTITSLRHRLARQRSLLSGQGGLASVRTLRRLYATEGELAFHKRRLEVRHRKRPAEMRVDELRDEVRRLRRALGEEA